ncbi:MAG: hypothetical protein ACI9W2_003976, partial [Gammaproteobacteria bacterium]
KNMSALFEGALEFDGVHSGPFLCRDEQTLLLLSEARLRLNMSAFDMLG